MAWHALDEPADARDGAIVPVDVAGERLALVRAAGAWAAVADACTHDGCAFSEHGELYDGGVLGCLCHGAEFDLATGAVLAEPAVAALRVFAVEERDGRLVVELAEGG